MHRFSCSRQHLSIGCTNSLLAITVSCWWNSLSFRENRIHMIIISTVDPSWKNLQNKIRRAGCISRHVDLRHGCPKSCSLDRPMMMDFSVRQGSVETQQTHNNSLVCVLKRASSVHVEFSGNGNVTPWQTEVCPIQSAAGGLLLRHIHCPKRDELRSVVVCQPWPRWSIPDLVRSLCFFTKDFAQTDSVAIKNSDSLTLVRAPWLWFPASSYNSYRDGSK